MQLIQEIMTKPGREPVFNYYPGSDTSHEISKDMLVKEGWSISTSPITIEEYDEQAMCRFFERMAYSFYESGKEAA